MMALEFSSSVIIGILLLFSGNIRTNGHKHFFLTWTLRVHFYDISLSFPSYSSYNRLEAISSA